MIKQELKARDTAILAIGDTADYDSFCKLNKEKRYIKNRGFSYAATSYKKVLKEEDPCLEADNIIIFPFFPFKYWDKNIEHKKYRGLYGNPTFRNKFLDFCGRIESKIDKIFAGKRCFYINDLTKCAYYRDKKAVMEKLKKDKIDIPASVKTKSPARFYKMILEDGKFFIKPRCGSMGKGITYLEKDNWQTNFRIRKNKIKNRYSDSGWIFKDITNNRQVLDDLIARDFLVEEAIDSLCMGRHKVDFRVYIFGNEVLYIYPRMNYSDCITTNISQGGKGRPSLIQKIPGNVVRKIKKQALGAAKSLGLGFCGIDVVVDRGMKKAYVVDVNMFPGFPKRRTFNLARSIIDELSG